MREKIEKIASFLKQDSRSVITVIFNGRKLAKPTKTMKYAFSESDILETYGSIENFINKLPDKGFGDGTNVVLRKCYGDSYHNLEKVELIFNEVNNVMANNIEAPVQPISVASVPQSYVQPQSPAMAMPSVGMGYASVPQNEWLDTKVKEQRFNEIEFQLKKVQEELLDAKSKLRVAEEQKNNLQLKLDTAKERHELNLEKALRDKKGFFETPSGEKVMEVVGMAMPQLLAMATKTPAVGMGTPNLSQAKQQLISVIQQDFVTDEMVMNLYQSLENLVTVEENGGNQG